MIFETFDNIPDTSKTEVPGKLFSELTVAAKNAFLSSMKELMNFDENTGFVENLVRNLFPKKDITNDWIRNSIGDILTKENIDSYVKELDLDSAKKILETILNWDDGVKNNSKSWQDYFDTCKNGNEYLIDLIKNTGDLSRLTGEDLVKANRQARNSALAHNEAVKAQTLSAKVGKAAFHALAAAGNMLANAFITKGIQFISQAIDHLVHQSQYAKEAMEDAKQAIIDSQNRLKSVNSTISENRSRFLDLSEGVSSFSENISLSETEYAEYLAISDEFAALSPSLVSGYTDQGNALLYIGNTAEETSAKLDQVLESERALAQQTLIENMDDVANGVHYEVKEAEDRIAALKSQLSLSSQNAASPESLDHLIQRVNEHTMSINLDTANGLEYDEIEQLRNLILHSGARVVTYEGYDSLNFAAEDYARVKKAIDDFYSQISYAERNGHAAFINGLNNDIAEQEQIISGAYSSMNPLISTWVQDTYEYGYFNETQKNLVDALVPNLDWYSLHSETGRPLAVIAEYKQYIRESILTPLMRISDEERPKVDEKIAQLLQFEPGDIHMADYAAGLEAYLHEIGVTIDLTPLLGNTGELKKQYEQITTNAAYRFIENSDKNYSRINEERDAIHDFAEQYSVNTQDEIIFWERCLEESETLQEAMEKYLSSSFVTATPQTPLSISETVQQIDTRLRSAFSSLRSAYQEIFTLDEATGETRFSLDGADITDKFNPILDAIKSLGELDGITVDYSAFDDFVSVLSDTSSTEADVQAQFDSLATSIIYASDCTNMSAETFNLLAESLSELGISNARETLEDILALQQSLAAAGIDAQTAMSGEADALQNLQIAGTETAEQLMAYYIQKQFAENPLTTLNDILQLENLCNALGVTGEMLQTITALKLAFEAKESGAHAGGLDESIKAYQERLKELAAGYGTYGFEFGSAGTKSGFSSSGSRSRTTAETFDWTVQAIENIENEIKALDDIADSSYSTLAQKNEALAQQIGKVNDAVALGQQAYDIYMQKAEAVGLSGHYKDLVQNGAPGMEDITDETLKKQISEYQKWYEKAQETQNKIDSLYEKAKDIHVSSYENCVQELDTLRDNDTISEREYLDRMNALWEHHYENQTEYAVQAKEAKLKLLKDEKNYLESVANTAADLLGGQIDELKNRQEAEIEVLEAKKRPLEVQLELLEKQKEEEDRILSLQKAQYELKRAEQQRDKLTYVDGQMIYRADETNLRNARDAVDEAKYNIEKASIEDRINAYDKEIDKIKERYDAEIAGMERLENEWQNALALRERAQSFGDFESMFGEGSAARLLDGDSSFISTWKQTYLNTLGGIDMVSGGMIGEMTTRYAELAGLDLSNITEQTKTVASQFHAVNDAVNSLNNAIGTESPNTENNAPADKPSANAESASLSDALQNTYDVASEVLPEEAAMLNAVTEAANTAAAAVNELKTAIASLNALSLTPDSIAVSGSAYASGTRHAKKGLAIVGEEKPEMIITTDQKAYLAKQPTLLRMEGGETVLSGDETAKMLKARGFQPIKPDEFPLLKAFAAYSPEEIRQRFAPQMISPAGTTASAALQNAEHAVNNNSINNTPFYTTGDIHIHCPGITKDEVARQIGTELTNVFSGLSLKAYQRASITR